MASWLLEKQLRKPFILRKMPCEHVNSRYWSMYVCMPVCIQSSVQGIESCGKQSLWYEHHVTMCCVNKGHGQVWLGCVGWVNCLFWTLLKSVSKSAYWHFKLLTQLGLPWYFQNCNYNPGQKYMVHLENWLFSLSLPVRWWKRLFLPNLALPFLLPPPPPIQCCFKGDWTHWPNIVWERGGRNGEIVKKRPITFDQDSRHSSIIQCFLFYFICLFY